MDMSFIVAACVLVLALIVSIIIDDKAENMTMDGRRQTERTNSIGLDGQ
jgi:hypothetical protein